MASEQHVALNSSATFAQIRWDPLVSLAKPNADRHNSLMDGLPPF